MATASGAKEGVFNLCSWLGKRMKWSVPLYGFSISVSSNVPERTISETLFTKKQQQKYFSFFSIIALSRDANFEFFYCSL